MTTQAYEFFCDFDGTISESDMIVQTMKEFAPEAASPIIEDVVHRRLSVKTGVERMFALIESEKYNEVVRFTQDRVRVRAGFDEFVRLCSVRHWPLAVVSGGFDFFVEYALAAYRDEIAIYANRLDTSGEHLRVVWSHPCDEFCDGGCGLCKPSVIRTNGDVLRQQVVIGDGVTDLKAARMADFVFARSGLLEVCREENIPHAPYTDFHDIVRRLESRAPFDSRL